MFVNKLEITRPVERGGYLGWNREDILNNVNFMHRLDALCKLNTSVSINTS